jgi:hypothetical protein
VHRLVDERPPTAGWPSQGTPIALLQQEIRWRAIGHLGVAAGALGSVPSSIGFSICAKP